MLVYLWLRQIQRRWFGRRSRMPRVRRVRPWLESLEDRTVPTTIDLSINPAANPSGAVQELIQALNTANSSSDPTNTINLYSGGVYDLTQINNYWYGPNGLPAISSTITLNGNGATIERDTNPADGTPAFRLLYVSAGFDGLAAGSLALNNLTLEGGVAQGGSVSEDSSLTLQDRITLQARK